MGNGLYKFHWSHIWKHRRFPVEFNFLECWKHILQGYNLKNWWYGCYTFSCQWNVILTPGYWGMLLWICDGSSTSDLCCKFWEIWPVVCFVQCILLQSFGVCYGNDLFLGQVVSCSLLQICIVLLFWLNWPRETIVIKEKQWFFCISSLLKLILASSYNNQCEII